MDIKLKAINEAQAPRPGDLGNKVLYDLCSNHSKHTREDNILAKTKLIGRAYAVALDRRRNKEEINEDFYLKKVVPKFKNSKIDSFLEELRKKRMLKSEDVNKVLYLQIILFG